MDASRRFYFAFGENDAHVILELPDNLTAAAISLAVTSTGAVGTKTTVLLTPEEIDQAVKSPVDYKPPYLAGGWGSACNRAVMECDPSWRGFFGLLIAAQKVYPFANAAGVYRHPTRLKNPLTARAHILRLIFSARPCGHCHAIDAQPVCRLPVTLGNLVCTDPTLLQLLLGS